MGHVEQEVCQQAVKCGNCKQGGYSIDKLGGSRGMSLREN